jgi:fumarate hydratase subunit alpha
LREIHSDILVSAIKELFIKANYYLSSDVMQKLNCYKKIEISEIGKEMLDRIVQNAELAAKNEIAICQDTGMSVLFIELGQDIHISGENINDAINEGVRQAYKEGYLRKSVVQDPLNRQNTGDKA